MGIINLRAETFFVAGLLAIGTAVAAPPAYDPKVTRGKIEAVLPVGWTVIPATQDQERFFKDAFTHPETDAFTLLGPRLNYSEWTDKHGASHRDYIHKECIFLWLMPGNFKPKFPRTTAFNFFDPPAHPPLVYASAEVRVYAWVYQYTTNAFRANQILKEATQIWCPRIQPSWTNWQSAIAAKLRK